MRELQTASGSPSQTTLTYKLHVCTPEKIRNDRIRISETMQGTSSDLVTHILEKHLKTHKNLDIEQTDELRHHVMPNIHPFEAISRHLTSSAQGVSKSTSGFDMGGRGSTSNSVFRGNKVTDFYFYETTKGYRFKSLQGLFDPDMMFTIGSTPSTPGYLGQMTTSVEHEYMTPADTLTHTNVGGWGMRHIRHSGASKSFNITESNYHRSLENLRYAYVSETPVYSIDDKPDPNIKGEPSRISDYPQSRIIFDSASPKQNSNIIKSNDMISYPWSVPGPDRSLQRIMQTEHLMNYQLLTVRLHGISGLEAGMVLYLNLPDIGEGSGYLGGGDAWEDRLSNLWVIRSLSHNIITQANQPVYYMDITLSNLMRYTLMPLPKHDGTGSMRYKLVGGT